MKTIYKFIDSFEKSYLQKFSDFILILKYNKEDNIFIEAIFTEVKWFVDVQYSNGFPIIYEDIEQDLLVLLFNGLLHFWDKQSGYEIAKYDIDGLQQIQGSYFLVGERNVGDRTYLNSLKIYKFIRDKGKYISYIEINNIKRGKGIVIKEYFLYNNVYSLICHSLSDGSELWRLDVSEIGGYREEYYINDVKHEGERKVGEIKVDILVYENVVILSITPNQLLGVSAETGKILWEIDNIYKYSKQLYQNKIYSLSDADFFIIDALTGTLDLSVNLSDEIEKHGLCPYTGKFCTSEDYIYFISHHAVGIGALNLQTYQMDWVHFFETEDKPFPYSLQSIQYHQNRLYVLDSEGSLHIFDREDASS